MENTNTPTLYNRLIAYFPNGYRIYRRNCFLIENVDLDIMVQVSKKKNNLFCCLYSYIPSRKGFAISPLIFKGDEESVGNTIRRLSKVLASKNIQELEKSLAELSESIKGNIMTINLG